MLITLIRSYLSGQSISFLELMIGFASALFVIFFCLPVHEWAHALTANRLGDPTARHMGRLTINPMAHIDWLGAVFILLFGFGFAKPVPVNARNFHRPKWGMALVGLAGPLTNFLLAFLSFFLNALFGYLAFLHQIVALSYVAFFFYWAAMINLYLAAFNLIPLPPMDGSRVLFAFLPDRIYYRIQAFERYIYYLVILLAATGMLSKPTQWIADQMYSLCNIIINAVFSLFL